MTLHWPRRKVLFGGLLTVIPLAACPCTAQAQSYSGCWIPNDQAQPFINNHQHGESLPDGELVDKSGVEGLELALVQTLSALSTQFGILPGFSFYREHQTPNAKATSHNLMKNRSDGTVLVGLKLLKELLDLPEHPDAAIVGVCAHEFAHILSYSTLMIEKLSPPGSTAFQSEQFADYMAGYYAGRRKLETPDFPAVIFATTTSMYGGGDHGSPKQRGAAVEAGFLNAYVRKLEPAKAAQRALSFALGEDS